LQQAAAPPAGRFAVREQPPNDEFAVAGPSLLAERPPRRLFAAAAAAGGG
jgi:hypothetical protein